MFKIIDCIWSKILLLKKKYKSKTYLVLVRRKCQYIWSLLGGGPSPPPPLSFFRKSKPPPPPHPWEGVEFLDPLSTTNLSNLDWALYFLAFVGPNLKGRLGWPQKRSSQPTISFWISLCYATIFGKMWESPLLTPPTPFESLKSEVKKLASYANEISY